MPLAQICLIAIVAFTMTPKAYSFDTNLTAITWAHAVNSLAELNDALSSDVDMIEADIVLGTLIQETSTDKIPVMGHPPHTTSDISLQTFLNRILDHNQRNGQRRKGVKLDFKSTEVFEGSLELLKNLWDSMNYPVWINADIIPGPLENTETKPVHPEAFFRGCKQLPNSVLSIGWTTRWGPSFTQGNYTEKQTNAMLEAINKNGIPQSGHEITFPVRAGIAAQSLTQLMELANALRKTNNVTLTIWSSPQDNVDIDRLHKLIFAFGVENVYVDVPEEVSSQLDLGNAKGRASSLIHFGIASLSMFLLSIYFNNYQ